MENNLVLVSLALALIGFALYAWNSANRDFVIFQLIDLQRERAINLDPEVKDLQKRFHRLEAGERISIAVLIAYLILGLTISALAFACLLLALFRLIFEPRLNRLRDRDPWSVGETAPSDLLIRRISRRFSCLQYRYNTISKTLTVASVLFAALAFLTAFYFKF